MTQHAPSIKIAKINIWLGGDKKYLYFKDNWIGIPKDKLESIFDSFFTSNKKGGTGLGLPFCKRVMKAFGVDISCKSKEGEFTEFFLNLSNQKEFIQISE